MRKNYGEILYLEDGKTALCRRGTGFNESPWIYMRIPQDMEDAPWFQLHKETTIAYRAFMIYRDLGIDRTYPKVAMILHNRRVSSEEEKWNKPPQTAHTSIMHWAKGFLWRDRCAAWDQYQFREQERQWQDRQKMLRERQWDASENLFDKGMNGLANTDAEQLSAKDIARFLALASQLGSETKGSPVTTEHIRELLNACPEPLRKIIIENLKRV